MHHAHAASRLRTARKILCACLLTAALWTGCDTLDPMQEVHLVVEFFPQAGKPLPAVQVSRSKALHEPFWQEPAASVSDAEVTVVLDGKRIPYVPDPARAGYYVPVQAEVPPQQGASFSLDVRWSGHHVHAAGAIPPVIRIDEVQVRLSETPVKAVFADSLSLSDSLSLNVREGYLYQVEVSMFWQAEAVLAQADTVHWVRARLRPPATFPSAVIDFFLRTDDIRPEHQVERDVQGRKRWTGVYAVPVPSDTSAMPAHELQVYLLRSGVDYARYAATRKAPEQREPVSNVQGGIGIAAGIAMDVVPVSVPIAGQ